MIKRTISAALLTACVAAVGAQSASAASFSFGTDGNGSAQGWWDSNGLHYQGNTNYFTGDVGDGRLLRSFGTFRPSGVTGTVTCATYKVRRYEQSGEVELGLFDVSTDPDVLVQGATGRTDIYDDLGSGTSYGQFRVPNGGTGDVLSLALPQAALSAIQASLAGRFTLGEAVLSPSTGFIHSFSFDGNDHQLQIGTDGTPCDPTSNAVELAPPGPPVVTAPPAPGDVQGATPDELSISLSTANLSFGTLRPFEGASPETYSASTTLTLRSTAAAASVQVADPSPVSTGRLVNVATGPDGTTPQVYALRSPLTVSSNGGPDLSLESAQPVGSDTLGASATGGQYESQIPITFRQQVQPNEGLRTGVYRKPVVFTAAATTP